MEKDLNLFNKVVNIDVSILSIYDKNLSELVLVGDYLFNYKKILEFYCCN